MITLRQLTKRFGRHLAVDDLTFDVPRGDVFGLLGHNGAGKSTAIGVMLGQVWPTAGEVRIRGFEITRDRARALARVGAIFETPAFYDYLSGRRNLEILAHYSAPTASARIDEVIAWVGLTGRDRHAVRTYSHGMRARLALAQALLPDPELLILDEPTNGLDPEGIHEMRATIRRLHAEFGLTILLSSHLLSEVEQLCGRILVMNQGRKVFSGTLAEARPAQDWVRLKTDNFVAAAQALQNERMIRSVRAQESIALAPGMSISAVVRRLVELGFPIHEIAREAPTLESFYLSLMQAEPVAETKSSESKTDPNH